MNITGFRTRAVSVPADYPVVSAVRTAPRIEFVLLDVYSDEGLTGISYAQAFHAHGARAIRHCLHFLEQLMIGRSADDIEGAAQSMWNAVRLLGQQGLAAFAVSMVDMALWDLKGKRDGTTVCRLLGGEHRTLNAYCSEGLWLIDPVDAARQAEHFAGRGFTSMKMRLGRKDRPADIRAVSEVRSALGDAVKLMADVNQGWSVEQALYMGRELEPFGLYWLEEPIDAEDAEGHARLSSELGIPIATGENLYRTRSTRRFLQAKAASVMTPDLQRVGGITGWLELLPDFRVSGTPFSVHLFPEYAVHLLAAADADTGRGPALEWMNWASSLFQQPLLCKDGVVEVPDRPGFGMVWEEQRLAAWLID